MDPKSTAQIKQLSRIVRRYAKKRLDGDLGIQLDSLLRKLGFTILGAGGARLVVAIGTDLVAKVDYDPDATSNGSEQDFFRWNKESTSRLNPVVGVEAGGRILLMPRAQIVFDTVPKKYRKELREARSEIADLPDSFDRVDHEYDFNYGVVNEFVVLLDYNN